MNWSPRLARSTLILFLLVFAAGQFKAYLARPVYPDPGEFDRTWPPPGCLVDATVLDGQALRVFSGGTTIGEAVKALGLVTDTLGSGFCLPRAGVLIRTPDGWSVRTMTQQERWVWRLPMNVYRCRPQDFLRIQGIGPSLAGKVYRYVQEKGALRSLAELGDVKGIGPAKLQQLQEDLALN